MENQMAMLRREKRAMTMLDWLKEAKEYAEEVLDEKPLQALRKSPQQKEVYRSVATAGRGAYLRQLQMIEDQHLEGMDEMIAMETAADYKAEAMQAALDEKMELLLPGYREQYL